MGRAYLHCLNQTVQVWDFKKMRPPKDFKKMRELTPSDFDISRAFRPVHSENDRHTNKDHPKDSRTPEPRNPTHHQRHPTHDTRPTRPPTPEKLIRIPFHERPDPNREASGAAVPRRMASSISIHFVLSVIQIRNTYDSAPRASSRKVRIQNGGRRCRAAWRLQ